MTGLSIRFATPDDTAIAAGLLAAQLVEHHLPADADGIARGIALAFAPGSRAWLVLATRNGRPVGIALTNRLVSVEHGGEVLWLEELYVVPEERRTGIAAATLSFLEAEAAPLGIRTMELEVVQTQAAAFALYASRGFQRLDRQRLTKRIALT